VSENINTNITANADFSGLISQIHKAVSQLTLLQQKLGSSNVALTQQIAATNNAFSDVLRKSNQFNTHFVTLAGDTEKFGKALDAGKLKLRDYYQHWQQYHRQAGGMIRDLAKQQTALQNAIVQPMGRNQQGQMQFNVHVPTGINELANKTKIARTEMSILNKVMQEGSNQLINWGKNTQWAGRQLTVGLTVPMAAFGAAASKAFREADQELVRLTKVYGGLAKTSNSELTKVRADAVATARELSSSYGVSFKETLGLAADIAATGKTGNELLGTLRETTRLTVLGEIDKQEAMKATLAIQNAFKQDTDGLAKSINFLNAVENQTSTTLEDLVEAIPRAGTVVKGLGGGVEDLALMMVAMKEGGVDAASAANGLKSALASLINPTKVAKEQFAGFGINLTQIVEGNAGNITATIMELQKAMDKLNPLQKQQAIETLFGKYQFARMGALFDNLGKQGSQTLQVLDLMKASTDELSQVAGRELGMITESASGKYKRALESLKADLATVGEQFLGIATRLLNFADGVVNAFNKMPDPIKKMVTLLGGLTAVAGPIIMLTGVMANFLGYVMKGFAGIRAFFSHAEGFKLLTPEMKAANEAAALVEKTFYSDATAAKVLTTALNGMRLEMQQIATLSRSGTVTAKPIIAGAAEGVGIGSYDFAHYNPQSKLSEEARLAQTFHTSVPLDPSTNKKIGQNPQMMAMPGATIPNVPGLTSINGASTAINAKEAARWHTQMTVMAMRSKDEIAAVEKIIDSTGKLPAEFMADFSHILPKMEAITSTAAASSARVAAAAEAGILTVEKSQAALTAINAKMIERMNALSIASGVPMSSMTMVPGTGTTIATGTAIDKNTDYNMRSTLRSGAGRAGSITSKIAKAVGTSVRRIKFATGVTAIGKLLPKFTDMRRAAMAAKMLREKSSHSAKFSGWRTPNLRERTIDPKTGKLKRKSGSSTNKTAEDGASNYGKLGDRKNKIFDDPWLKEAGLTPTKEGEYLVHAYTPSYYKRTKGLEKTDRGVAKLPKDKLGDYGMGHIKTDAPYIEILPGDFIKQSKKFNEILNSSKNVHEAWTPVQGGDMASLLMFLKSQGKTPSQARSIADKAAQVVNAKMAAHNGPMTEQQFGKIINNAQVRALRSGYQPAMRAVVSSFGYDRHTRNRGLEPMPFQDGVTKLPGYGGGDTIPALLEPGESVVTKTATAGNEGAISYMNAGGKIPGFATGITSIGSKIKAISAARKEKLGQNKYYVPLGTAGSIGGSIGGGVLGKMSGVPGGELIGSLIGSSVLSRIIGVSKAIRDGIKTGAGFVNTIKMIGTALRLTGWGLFATGIAAAGLAMYKMWKNAKAQSDAAAQSFKVNEKLAGQLGIKYTTLSGKIKVATEDAKRQKQILQAVLETNRLAGGTGGLAMTIKELKDMQDQAKKSQPDVIKLFDSMDRKDVVANAAAMKAQLVAGGMAADKAAKMIFAIMTESNKASQAVAAISSKPFMEIKDKVSAATVSVSTFNKALGIYGVNGNELAAAFEGSMDSIDSYYNSLVGTKDETGKIITETEALKMTMDKLNGSAATNRQLGQYNLDLILKQKPELKGILAATDSTADAYAKIKLYTSGVVDDLSKISGSQAQAMLAVQAAVSKSATAMTTDTSMKNNPLASLAGLGAEAASASKTAAAQAAAASKAAQRDISKEAALIDKKIAAIKKEADARKKALQEQQEAADVGLAIQEQQLKYQNALATGNMNEAASAQIEIQRLTGQHQNKLAQQSIDDKANKDTEGLQSQKEGLAASLAAAQKAAKAAADKAAVAAERDSTIKTIQSTIGTLITNAGLTNDKDKVEAYGYQLRDQLEALRKLGKAGVAAANSIAMPTTVAYDGSTLTTKPQDYTKVIQDLAKKNLESAAATGKFSGAVDSFDKAVIAFQIAAGAGTSKNSAFKVDYNASYKLDPKKQNILTDTSKEAIVKDYGFKSGQFFEYNGRSYKVKSATDIVAQNYADGGAIYGSGTATSDSIPAMLSNGEFVVRASAVQKYGVGTMEAINSMKYASGGMISSYGNANRYATGGRLKFHDGGMAGNAIGTSVVINNDITVNGTNLTGPEIAQAIMVEQNRQISMSGKQRNF
jgi:TP901 family phage tail tape measure protein